MIVCSTPDFLEAMRNKGNWMAGTGRPFTIKYSKTSKLYHVFDSGTLSEGEKLVAEQCIMITDYAMMRQMLATVGVQFKEKKYRTADTRHECPIKTLEIEDGCHICCFDFSIHGDYLGASE